jgi:multicomponent Na+:H+ antiporter subunit E
MSSASTRRSSADARFPVGCLLRRIALFAVLWWVLSGGATGSWLIGAPLVLAAAGLSLVLWVARPIRWLGLLRFLPYFARQSLAGAFDVARRAFRPSLPLSPGLVRHRLRLPPGAARVAIANVISMLPGTLSADLAGDEVVIHALDVDQDLHAMVRDLEPRIAAIFGVEIPPGEERVE